MATKTGTQVITLATPEKHGMLHSNDKAKLDGTVPLNEATVTATGSSTARSLAERFGDVVNVRDFGAKGDGVTDDTAAIQAAHDATPTDGVLLIPASAYRAASGLTFSKQITISAYGAVIMFDADVPEAVRVGDASGGAPKVNIKGLKIQKAAYSGATENVGFLYRAAYQGSYQDLEARNFKYGHKFVGAPGKGFVYNTLTNLQSITHERGLWIAAVATGWVNENTFIGGRVHNTQSTGTPIFVDKASGDANHNRFIGTSAEGSAVQAVYDKGTSSNSYYSVRTEGTWSNADGADFVLAGSGAMVISPRYDAIVADVSATQDNIWLTYQQGIRLRAAQNERQVGSFRRLGANAANPGIPAMRIEDLYASSGYANVLELKAKRAMGTFLRGVDGDDVEVFALQANGLLVVKKVTGGATVSDPFGNSLVTAGSTETDGTGAAGVTAYVNDGTRNRRAQLFVDDAAGTFGLRGAASASGVTFKLNVAGSDVLSASGSAVTPKKLIQTRQGLTYGATVSVDANAGNSFWVTATNGTGFTVANPTNASAGQRITIRVRNTSGGALGTLTWDTAYRLAAWTQPADGYSRAIDFEYNGTSWIEVSRTPADVPN
jgi:hypothetical protein